MKYQQAPWSLTDFIEASLYIFFDFDNHLFELHSSTLEERLALYKTEQSTNQEGTWPNAGQVISLDDTRTNK